MNETEIYGICGAETPKDGSFLCLKCEADILEFPVELVEATSPEEVFSTDGE